MPPNPRPVPRLAHLVAVVALVAVAVGLAGCVDNPDVDSRAATAGLPDLLVNLSAQEWLLDPVGTSIGFGDRPVTLDVHPDRTVSGLAPCNTYRGAVELGDTTVTISNLSLTQRACDPAVTAAEEAYLAALTAVRAVELTDRNRLILSSPGGVRLAFNAFSAYDAIVGPWHVTNLAVVDALISPPAGVDLKIEFTDDRTVTVEAGCGPRSGTWSLDDNDLTVTDLAPGEACPSAEAGSFEAALVVALAGSHRVEVSPTTLTLFTSAGMMSVLATADPDNP